VDAHLTPRQLDFLERLEGARRRRFLEDVWSWVAAEQRRRRVPVGPVAPPDALVPAALAAVLSRPEWSGS